MFKLWVAAVLLSFGVAALAQNTTDSAELTEQIPQGSADVFLPDPGTAPDLGLAPDSEPVEAPAVSDQTVPEQAASAAEPLNIAAAGVPATAEEYYLKGKEAVLKGDYALANECFKKAEEMIDSGAPAGTVMLEDSVDVSSQTSYGQVLPDTQQPVVQNAASAAEQADSGNLDEQVRSAVIAGNIGKAIKLYREVLAGDPDDAAVTYNLGVLYIKEERYADAARTFEKAVELNKRDADAYYNLGAISENFFNEPDNAAKYYKKYAAVTNKTIPAYSLQH